MANVHFENFSVRVEQMMNDVAVSYLHEAAGEMTSQTAQNTRVDTGQLKGSWKYVVDEKQIVATVGSTLENAIWEEFGTGEYALHGDGRMGGWTYVDDEGKGHHTYGKTPNRALENTFTSLKNALIRRAEDVLRGMGS